MGFPMGFYDWWVCHQVIVYTEIAGHSGLRIHATSPSTLSWLLRYFEAELTIEDHDLHHRIGWRKAHNYCKQTGLWGQIFGTFRERIEAVEANIDSNNKVSLPLFDFKLHSIFAGSRGKSETFLQCVSMKAIYMRSIGI